MLLRQEYLEAVNGIERQMVVGDRLLHLEFGVGELTGGWAGHVNALYESGPKLFSDSDGIVMIPEDFLGGWVMLPEEAAQDWIKGFNAISNEHIKRRRSKNRIYRNNICRRRTKSRYRIQNDS